MAKAKKIAKSSSLAANRRKRKARKNPAPVAARSNPAANPPVASDLLNVIAPGFAAYAATRVIARVIYNIVQKKWPKYGKHAAVLAHVGTFAAMWFAAHRIKKIAPWHDSILMGSGIAAGHSVVTTYLPAKYSWLVADPKPSDVQPLMQSAAPSTQSQIASTNGIYDEYTELEAALEERRAPRPLKKATGTKPVSKAMQLAADDDGGQVALDPDLADALNEGEDVDDLYSGAFEQN